MKVLRKLLRTLYWDGNKDLDPRKLPLSWLQLRDVATELFRQLRVDITLTLTFILTLFPFMIPIPKKVTSIYM